MGFKLYQNNYLEVIKDVSDNTIDLLLTDPPYLHIRGGSKCKRINRGIYKKNIRVWMGIKSYKRA